MAVPTRTTGPAAAVADPVAPARDEPEPEPQPKLRSVRDGDAFDLWLRRSLRETFDAIAAEPIPEDLLRLVEEDRGERDRIRRARARGRRP
jgi:hypothetical protein